MPLSQSADAHSQILQRSLLMIATLFVISSETLRAPPISFQEVNLFVNILGHTSAAQASVAAIRAAFSSTLRRRARLFETIIAATRTVTTSMPPPRQ
ncbi:hypothetical protein HDV57DRAFT_490735 [Trichoderma longibrachiatum]